MKITYDKSSDVAYITLDIEDGVPQQDHVDGEWPINIDISKKGNVMGIEILNASTLLKDDILSGKAVI